jgi:hypothetical protein
MGAVDDDAGSSACLVLSSCRFFLLRLRLSALMRWEEDIWGLAYGDRVHCSQQTWWQFVHILFLEVNSVEQE